MDDSATRKAELRLRWQESYCLRNAKARGQIAFAEKNSGNESGEGDEQQDFACAATDSARLVFRTFTVTKNP